MDERSGCSSTHMFQRRSARLAHTYAHGGHPKTMYLEGHRIHPEMVVRLLTEAGFLDRSHDSGDKPTQPKKNTALMAEGTLRKLR